MSEEKSINSKAVLCYSLIHVLLGNKPATMPAKDMARLGIIVMVNSVCYYGLGDSFTDFTGVERESRFCPVSSLIKAGVSVTEESDYT